MIWCRFQKDRLISYGIVEGDTVTAVGGDPFSDHRTTSSKFKLGEVKLLVTNARSVLPRYRRKLKATRQIPTTAGH